ncbi:MAG: protein translocase subunit SecD [Sphingomonadaceae bacterium]
MLDFSPFKIWSITLLLIVGVALSVPSFLSEERVEAWPDFLPSARVNLGLDLAGGSELLLEADTSQIARQRLDAMEDMVQVELRRASPRIAISDISTRGGRLSFMVRDLSRLDAAVELARGLTQPVSGLGGQRDWDVRVVDSTRIVMTPSDAGLAEATDNAVETATDIVRRRIDELGTREPTIIRSGAERILVQVPGLEDPEALKELLGRTARLEFKLVDLSATPEQIEAGRAPIGSEILPMEEGGSIALRRRAMVTGEQLVEANQGFDAVTNEPVVNIRFDSAGARRFGRVTRENVGKPFAIVLDDEVISAPTINEPILGGAAQISGSFTVESANALAISLRSGALPVDLEVIQERTVGPDLGRESIRLGAIACLVAVALVLFYMFLTYGRFGLYADVALVLNVFLILGIMALLDATLTLPGIAGFVLTIGAAVDANVIINERIREEQRRGRRTVQAVEHGYKEAQTAIFDANITNVIAGALLFYFGSGPVRGFAVVMVIGIITSVFTAVVVTRMLVSVWLRRRRPQLLRI